MDFRRRRKLEPGETFNPIKPGEKLLPVDVPKRAKSMGELTRTGVSQESHDRIRRQKGSVIPDYSKPPAGPRNMGLAARMAKHRDAAGIATDEDRELLADQPDDGMEM